MSEIIDPFFLRHGWVVVDKPLGLTSAQVVNRVKKALNVKKIGHGGTLDPLATGLLPLAVGEATKLVSFAMEGEKTYRFTVKWGEATTTEDQEGVVVQTSPVVPTENQIKGILAQFLGDIDQMPPKYSALKVKGQRAYELARNNQVFDLKPRRIRIHSLSLLAHDSDRKTSDFEVMCSKGTYVRSLGRDIALKLGSCGHLVALRRLKVGCFSIENAILLDSIAEIMHKGGAGWFPMLALLDDILALTVEDQVAKRLNLGQRISVKEESKKGLVLPAVAQQGLPFICVTCNKTPIALVSVKEGCLVVERGFNCS